MKREFINLLIDAGYGRCANFSADEVNAGIRKGFAEILGIDENEKNAAVIRKAMRKHGAEVYEYIETVIADRQISGWGDNPFFSELVEMRVLSIGQKNEFYIPDRSILTVSKFAGGHHDLIRQKLGTGKSYSVPMSTYGIKVYEEFVRFQSGITDWTKLIEKLYEAVDKFINDMIYASFVGIEKEIPATHKITGSATVEKILELADRIQAETGREVIMCGSRAALSKVANMTQAGWVAEKAKEERHTSGSLATFEGIQTAVIPQSILTKDGKFAYPNDTVFFLPKTDDKPIKVVSEGDGQFFESLDPTARVDMTVEATYMFNMGVATVFGDVYGSAKLV